MNALKKKIAQILRALADKLAPSGGGGPGWPDK